MQNKTRIIILSAFFSMLLVISVIRFNTKQKDNSAFVNSDVITVLIDAGHGGDDPGSVVAEVKEAEINLKIALYLKEILLKSGFDIIMTRSDENGLTFPEKTQWNKIDDMAYRRKIIDSAPYDIMISIHQNYYADESVRGSQVFFSSCLSENEHLAEFIQTELKEISKVPNNRQIAKNDEYIVLKNNDKPSVLVECGFLSNSDERAILQTQSYQVETATAIYKGIYNYLSSDFSDSSNQFMN